MVMLWIPNWCALFTILSTLASEKLYFQCFTPICLYFMIGSMKRNTQSLPSVFAKVSNCFSCSSTEGALGLQTGSSERIVNLYQKLYPRSVILCLLSIHWLKSWLHRPTLWM